MRSAFIVATFTLSILAAPVPEAKSIEQKGGALCIKHSDPACFGTRKTQTEARSLSSEKGGRAVSNVNDVEESEESVAEYLARRDAEPEPINQGANAQRSAELEPFTGPVKNNAVEGDEEVEEPELEALFSRASHARSAEPEPFTRAGAGRREPKPAVGHGQSTRVEDVQARGAIRNHDGKRSPAPGRVRWGGRSVCQPELDSNHCGTQHKRSIEDPVNDDGHHAGAEAELAFSRAGAGRRSAEPEPVVTGPGAGGAHLCLKGGKWVRC